MSFGGAASVDYALRTPGKDWWPEEMPTEDEVERAILPGPVDVLITHEAIDGLNSKVDAGLLANPQGWGSEELAYSRLSRERITKIWTGTRPLVAAHGRMHLRDEVHLADGRSVFSLDMDGRDGNVGQLSLSTLEWTWLPRSKNS